MTAVIKRTGSVVDAIDLFCGYGGSSQGIVAAGAEVVCAANHSQLALECHAANYPGTEHMQADFGDADNPQVVNAAGNKVPGHYLDPALLPAARFLWASPSCKFHSSANAKKIYAQGPQASFFDEEFDHVQYANSERSRVTMICPLRYAAHRFPEIVVVENVVECAQWGPARDGSTVRSELLEAWTELDNAAQHVSESRSRPGPFTLKELAERHTDALASYAVTVDSNPLHILGVLQAWRRAGRSHERALQAFELGRAA